jgi:hypothetical protein
MEPVVAGFLKRFESFGAKPSVEAYLAFFHPDATLLDAGMERPLTVPEIPEHIEGVLRLVPDYRMQPERARERAGTVFVEAWNTGTIAGRPVGWRAVYVVDLVGDRVARGRRYYDRRPLFALVGAQLPVLPPLSLAPEPAPPGPALAGTPADFVARRLAAAAGAPDALATLFRDDGCLQCPWLGRPVARAELAARERALAARLPGLRLELERAAGDEALAFFEWKARAEVGGRPLAFGLVERFDLTLGQALHARAYFDTLALAAALAAANAA